MSARKERFMVLPWADPEAFMTARILRRGLTEEEALAMQAEAARNGHTLLIYRDSSKSRKSKPKGDE